MVFSSLPPYLDHHNWHHELQHSNPQQEGVDGHENPNLPPPAQRQPPPQPGGGGRTGGGPGSIRQGSMVDQARQINLPLPEPGLNCPRCDSTNTKFCYFNNYSLTQPRHFCKACKRYWTRGGALRNVPVGGSCRRNKRNNKRNSKSPNQARPKSITHESPSSNCSTEIRVNTQIPHPPSLQLPFMTSLGQYSAIGSSNLSNFQPQHEMGSFQLASSSSRLNSFNNILSIGGGENWRPFLAGFEVPNNTNLFQYQSENVVEEVPSSSIIRGDTRLTNCAVDNTMIDPPVKIEEPVGLNLSRQFLNVSENTNQEPWVANTWEEFSGVNTCSTSTTHFI